MYVGEYLNDPNSASVTVSGFHEADFNWDIHFIWTDHSHYVFGIQYKTQIRFSSTVLFSARCSVWSKDWIVTSLKNNQSWLRNIQWERRPQLHTCLLLCTLLLSSLIHKQNVPISLGRWGCSLIQSFRCSTASLTRCSFRPNSLLNFSTTFLLGGSITCRDILNLETHKSVRCFINLQFFYSKMRLYISISVSLKSAFI